MNAALRVVMVAADAAGTLEGIGVRRGRAAHPVCGDIVELSVKVERGAVADYAWRARGCPATVAVAAAAAAALRDRPVAEVPAALRQRLTELGGLATHEAHAERLLLDALRQAGAAPAAARAPDSPQDQDQGPPLA